MTDAKEMWNAIKSRFGGNDESKKMQKYILKQQFEGFTVSNTDGIHKGYERFQSLLSQLEIHGAGVSTKDANRILRSLTFCLVYKFPLIMRNKPGWTVLSFDDLVQQSKSPLKMIRRDGIVIMEIKDGSETGKKEESKALVTVDEENLIANLKRLYDAQREQLSDASVEIKAYTQGLKKVEAQLVAHQQGQLWYEQKIKFMKIDLDDKTDVLTYHKKLLAKAQKEKDDLEINKSDFENLPLHKRLAKTGEMQAVPPPMTGNYLPSGPDIKIDDSQYTYGLAKTQPSESESQTTELDTCDSNISTEPSELVSEPVVNESNVEVQPKVWSDAPIIEEYESDSDDEYVSVQTKGLDTPSFANKQVKTPRENVKNQSTHSQKPKVNNKELGHGF
ncbi:hypothetical protein Tco_0033021 [Tanacetum coccineum]